MRPNDKIKELLLIVLFTAFSWAVFYNLTTDFKTSVLFALAILFFCKMKYHLASIAAKK